MWEREDHVHVRDREQLLLASSQPLITSVGLTLCAMAIATRVIRDSLMPAARALIQMSAQRRRAATLDCAQHPEVLPLQSGSVLLGEALARCTNDIGHLEGWRIHLLC